MKIILDLELLIINLIGVVFSEIYTSLLTLMMRFHNKLTLSNNNFETLALLGSLCIVNLKHSIFEKARVSNGKQRPLSHANHQKCELK